MTKGRVIALALTWDGARWPVAALPIKARAFLKGGTPRLSVPTATAVAKLLAEDQVKECRICWVPRLKGGDDVSSVPFPATTGKRIGFRPARLVLFGAVLGVVYRRT